MNAHHTPSTAATAPRPSVIQLNIKEKSALYAAYMPFFATGGLFIPSNRGYKLGDAVYVLVSLPDDPQRYPVAGKVGWVTPAKAAGARSQGIGVVFPPDDKCAALKLRIEEILGAQLGSERATQTL